MTTLTALVGLPSSGKSTFVAALYHVLENPPANASLRLNRTPTTTHYLQEIEGKWSDLEELERTKSAHLLNIELDISDARNGEEYRLNIPDLDGEEFMRQWERRVVSEEFIDLAKNCSGILLFASQDVKKPVNILEIDERFRTDGAMKVGEDPEDVEPSEESEFSAIECPHGVILVDLLQIVSLLRGRRPFRLAVVVSAWDRALRAAEALDQPITPEQWLNENLPLLGQYIRANFSTANWKVFGVSAQGGSYEGADRERLEKCFSGSDRIILQEGSVQVNDLSRIISWVAATE